MRKRNCSLKAIPSRLDQSYSGAGEHQRLREADGVLVGRLALDTLALQRYVELRQAVLFRLVLRAVRLPSGSEESHRGTIGLNVHMPNLSRRQLLSATAAAAFSASLPGLAAAGVSRQLVCQSRVLDVNGKAATVLGLGGDGTRPGLVLGPDERFRVSLINRLAEPTLVHWHGLIPPNAQDGVPDVTQPALAPGASHHYDFQPHTGSHWMHSHVGLQRQNLLSAPLIVRSREDLRADMQEHVMFLHDFTFRDPEDILAGLIAGKGHGHAPGGMQHPNAKKMGHRMSDSGQGMQSHDRSNAHGARQHEQSPAAPMKGPMPGHLNDVEFDAYLANDRTLDDPEIVRVERGGRLRLRLINGAAATNFVIDLGQLDAQIVAVDGNPVQPMKVSAPLPLAMAQRVDVLIQLPAGEGRKSVV